MNTLWDRDEFTLVREDLTHRGIQSFQLHALWKALTLLQEEKLDETFRINGAKALIAHDMMKVTGMKPEWCVDEIDMLLEEMLAVRADNYWDTDRKSGVILKFYDLVGKLINEQVLHGSALQQVVLSMSLAVMRHCRHSINIIRIGDGLSTGTFLNNEDKPLAPSSQDQKLQNGQHSLIFG